MREIRSIQISDEAQVGAARRAAHDYASRLGFSETELAEIDIVVQEIGTNAAAYATGGGWLHYTTTLGSQPGLELFYWDAGPGIYDLDRAVRDGVSTSGSLGAGMGAIRRLMDEFDVYSTVKQSTRLSLAAARRTTHGTALLARKWVAPARPVDLALAKRIGVWCRPHPNEQLCGDAYFMRERDGRTLLAVIDGLGHGGGAKQPPIWRWNRSANGWASHWIKSADHARCPAPTRARGDGVAVIDYTNERFEYAGVGNVAVRVFGAPEPINPISTNGTLGARLGNVRVWTYPWTTGATVVMTSDGLSASWEIASYPGLLNRSPQILAGVLMRDYGRSADDATVLVAR